MVINEHWGTPNTKYAGGLWKENAILNRKPITVGWKKKKLAPFPASHELIFLSVRAHVLDTFRILSGCETVDAWIETKPTWEAICAFSERIYNEFASSKQVYRLRKLDDLDLRDICRENSILQLRDCLIYMVLVFAVKRGDSGVMWNVLVHWMVMMRGTGCMPKYSDCLFKTHMFLKNADPKIR